MLTEGGPPREASWREVKDRLVKLTAGEWFHASGLDASHLAEIARDTGIAPTFLAQTLQETAYPRIEIFHRFAGLFMWVPTLDPGDEAPLERTGVLVLATEHGVLTVDQRAMALQEEVIASMGDMELPRGTFAQRTVLALLTLVLRRYEAVAGQLEHHTRALELHPVRDSGPVFLERSFRLQRRLATVKHDLWRLKGIVEAIADRRLLLHGMSAAIRDDEDGKTEANDERSVGEYLRMLADEASYTYETAVNAREALLALIDLHINVVSFEMNKVMRVLAVLSGLGLIPAIVGGLLGMNIFGNPWPVSLAQVSFGVTTAMVLALYVFAMKGWLR
jgi:Mg2+ and Co2+ transporter CorA